MSQFLMLDSTNEEYYRIIV